MYLCKTVKIVSDPFKWTCHRCSGHFSHNACSKHFCWNSLEDACIQETCQLSVFCKDRKLFLFHYREVQLLMPFHCMSKTSVHEAEAQQNLKNYASQKKKKSWWHYSCFRQLVSVSHIDKTAHKNVDWLHSTVKCIHIYNT